jgi:hypothetical protein
LALLPLADSQANDLLTAIPEDARNECWWLVLRDGTAVPGNKGGGVMLLAEMRLTQPLAQVLRTLQLSSFVDTADNLLARYRSRLGRLVPEGPAPRRYP